MLDANAQPDKSRPAPVLPVTVGAAARPLPAPTLRYQPPKHARPGPSALDVIRGGAAGVAIVFCLIGMVWALLAWLQPTDFHDSALTIVSVEILLALVAFAAWLIAYHFLSGRHRRNILMHRGWHLRRQRASSDDLFGL